MSCFFVGLLACLLFPLMPADEPSLVWEWMAEGLISRTVAARGSAMAPSVQKCAEWKQESEKLRSTRLLPFASRSPFNFPSTNYKKVTLVLFPGERSGRDLEVSVSPPPR